MNSKIIVGCFLLAFNSGCASIMCSDHKTINVQSDPPGAQFDILKPNGSVVTQGTTPTNITLKRGRGYFQAGDYTIRFTKDGYEDLTMPVEQGFETGWYFAGNIIVFGGLIGVVIVDPITGAMWDIKDVRATLSPAAVVKIEGKERRVSGYEAHINPATGKMETVPVYEDGPKYRMKKDAQGEPVKDAKGNFIFEPVEEKD